MNKEQQPQTEAEAMKAAAESWDTPVEKNGVAVETIAPNTETMEDDPMDMEIQNESAELEKNSEAVEKALVDVGGMEGLELTLKEMPEDEKMAMMKKLKEEYEKDREKRRYNIDSSKFMAGQSLKMALNPFEFFRGIGGGEDGIGSFVGSATATVAAFLSLVGPAFMLKSAAGYGIEHILDKRGMNMAERRHKKELKKLENSEA